MTNEQINAAIAKACGWWGNQKENCMRPPNRTDVYCLIPDYLNDLNAMHEAEKVLTEDQFKWYTHWLEKLMPNTGYRSLLCAPASRRAEAFLRVMGKWEEVAK